LQKIKTLRIRVQDIFDSFALTRAGAGDIYDILQSKEDKATVPIYYEARLAKIDLKPEERPKIDSNFEEVTEDAEESTKEACAGSGRSWRRWSGRASVNRC
jgi:type I site-specific restriction-modification system R (restriction) subunit